MKFLLIFLAIIVGVIVFLGLLALIIYTRINKTLNSMGLENIKNVIQNPNNSFDDGKTRVKNATGMTKLLLPKINNDFPNFSEVELFSIIETNLRLVFNSIETKSIDNLNKVPILRDSLIELITDYKDNNISITYDDIKFYKHAIKRYEKSDGVATITTTSALSYYYKKVNGNKIVEESTSLPKQTSYTCKFIYIYDPTKVKDHKKLIGLNCPNCGAPVTDLGNKVCEYCHTGLEDINLRAWMFSSYKEDY